MELFKLFRHEIRKNTILVKGYIVPNSASFLREMLHFVEIDNFSVKTL